MLDLIKKIKEHILTIFIFAWILSLGGVVNLSTVEDTEFEILILSWFMFLIGLSTIIWCKQIGKFVAKMNTSWPFPIPERWVSLQKLSYVYGKIYLLYGIILLLASIRSILLTFTN